MAKVHFVFCVHNHQPVGNFDHVIEGVYQQAYLPFLRAMESYPAVKFVIHNSGCLWEWIEAAHPEYMDLLRSLIERGQVEILTGGFYEPILAMIPDEDKVSQIRLYSRHLEDRLGVSPEGLWLAERVWEPQLPRWLKEAGVRYTALDDFHFRAGGLEKDQLVSHFSSEDQGHMVQVFAMREDLRYLIPFRPVKETREYLRSVAEKHPGSLAVFGDDGEKLGAWPGTHRSVFEQGWLESFLEMLEENHDWLRTVTFSEWLSKNESAGLVYLPTLSYPEMMEWALPADRWDEYRQSRSALKERFEYQWSPPFLRGGFWRNFLSKYPESYRMYRKMLHVRGRLAEVSRDCVDGALEPAWRELWRGQCNCAYWHGVFGGLYLKHLRSEVYRRVIHAETLLDRHCHGQEPWFNVQVVDFDGDGADEILLSSPHLNVYVSPRRGGSAFEIDFKTAGVNLQATMARRREGYHSDLAELSKSKPGGSSAKGVSIHDRVLAKEDGLECYLWYDPRPADSWIEHFVLPTICAREMRENRYRELGDFPDAEYDVLDAGGEGHASLTLARKGTVETPAGSRELTLRKTMVLSGAGRIALAYEIEAVTAEAVGVCLGSVFNLAMSTGRSPECCVLLNGQRPADHDFESEGETDGVDSVALADGILGIRVDLSFDRPARLVRFPVITVSLSDGGFEKSYQSSVLLPLWEVQTEPGKPWKVNIRVSISEFSGDRVSPGLD